MIGDWDPLAGTPWSAPDTVAGFARSHPNHVLMRYAADELDRHPAGRALDVGCGAGRNAGPLAEQGWNIVGTDLSWPMLTAAADRASHLSGPGQLDLLLAPMDRVPLQDSTFDLVIAHGIWNLARSAAEFRRAVGEAARVAKSGALLFVFTFSRNTFAADVAPVAGEPFVFTQFSNQPQCFLTDSQLVAELGAAGFVLDPRVPITEYNRPATGTRHGGAPVIYEALFRRAARTASGD